jgi:hypothetical protein
MVTWVKMSKSETLGLVAEADTCMLCSQSSDLGKKYRLVKTFLQTSSQKKESNWKQCARNKPLIFLSLVSHN